MRSSALEATLNTQNEEILTLSEEIKKLQTFIGNKKK